MDNIQILQKYTINQYKCEIVGIFSLIFVLQIYYLMCLFNMRNQSQIVIAV